MNPKQARAAARYAFGENCAVVTGHFAVGTAGNVNLLAGAGIGDQLTEDGVHGRVEATVVLVLHSGTRGGEGRARRRR